MAIAVEAVEKDAAVLRVCKTSTFSLNVLSMQNKHVNLIDIVKSFLASIQHFPPKIGFGKAENEPFKVC